jgi:hypothetical protein
MEEVQKVLNNPVIRQGLKVAAPELALGVELAVGFVTTLFGRRKRRLSVKKLAGVVDQRLAKILTDIATTKSKHHKQECEIRAHELLGILNTWEKLK